MSPRRLWAVVTFLWLALSSADVALAALLPEGFLRLQDIGLLERLFLAGTELFWLAVFVAAAFLPALVLSSLADRFGEAGSGGRLLSAAAYACEALAVFALLSFFAWSWAGRWSIGHFFGFDMLRFLADSGGQVVLHVLAMRPWGFVGLNALVLGAGAVYLFSLRPRIVRSPAPAGREVFVLSGVLLALSSALAAGTAIGATWAVPLSGRGPAAYLAGDVLGRGGGSLPTDVSGAVERRPLEPLENWLSAVDPSAVQRHNVLVVLVESLRPDELLAFGGDRRVMPAVEAVAAESRLFPEARSQASHSNYSDLCVLTSQYPLRDRTLYLYDADSEWPRVMIYDLLDRLGWRTAIFSSQNENWGSMAEWLETDALDVFFHAETFDGPTYLMPGDGGFTHLVTERKMAGKVDDRHTVSAAIDWIRSSPDPFFVYLNLQSSHAPYFRPPDFPPRFGPEEVDFEVSYGRFPRDRIDVVKDLYSDSLAYADFQLGRLLRALADDGRLEDTVVVITSDTGQAFYEHGFASHGTYLYEEVVRIPLVLRAPGLEAAIDGRPAQQIDVPPTLLDLLGLPPHPAFQGRSLVGPPAGEARPVFLVAQTPMVTQYAVVLEGWKLMLDVRDERVELYHLDEDPGETRDLAEERPEIRQELLDLLLEWVLLQLDYHETPERFRAEYPPVLTMTGGVEAGMEGGAR